jgi:hypothetical protein
MIYKKLKQKDITMNKEIIENILSAHRAKRITNTRGALNAKHLGEIRVNGSQYMRPDAFANYIFALTPRNAVIEQYITNNNISADEAKEIFLYELLNLIDYELEQLDIIKQENADKKLNDAEQIDLFLKEMALQPSERKYVSVLYPVIQTKNIDITGFSYTDDGRTTISWDEFATFYSETCEDNKQVFTLNKNAESKLHRYLKNLENDWILKKRNELKFDPKSIPNADYFLDRLFDIYQPSFISLGDGLHFSNRDMYKAVIRHFIWEIKRRGFNGHNAIDNGYLLCLSGPQGNGKTTFFEKLCKDFLGNKYTYATIDTMGDDFSAARLFVNKFVINFDEMIRLKSENVQVLKSYITASIIEKRKMHSQEFIFGPRTAVFCGTSNRPVYSVCYDNTGSGSRRYVNIEYTCSSIQYDNEKINELKDLFSNYTLDLWKSVDENLERGYFDSYDDDENVKRLEFARNFYIPSTNLEKRWMEANNYKLVAISSNRDVSKYTTISTGYKEFKKWCKEEHIPHSSEETFNSFMRNLKKNVHFSKLRFKKSYKTRLDDQIKECLEFFEPLNKEAVIDYLNESKQLEEERNTRSINDSGNPIIDELLSAL